MNLQTELNFRGVQETSRIAYHENKEGKSNMVKLIVSLVSRGFCTILHLEEASGMKPNCVSGRVNDAMKAGLIRYEGTIHYKGMKRKKIVMV